MLKKYLDTLILPINILQIHNEKLKALGTSLSFSRAGDMPMIYSISAIKKLTFFGVLEII